MHFLHHFPPAKKCLPSFIYVLLPIIALWPNWQWSAARFADGSDDPLGILALVALVFLSARERHFFLKKPRLFWLMASFLLALLSGAARFFLPALAQAALATFAVLAAIISLQNAEQPKFSWFLLGVLSLPLLASLQFFVGFPLRVLTAECSLYLLQMLGLEVTRSGTVLFVNGQAIMVDAPCSGIQMAWVTYFVASFSASFWRIGDRLFLKTLPLISALILSGNILRNTLLMLKESAILPLPEWTHEGIGLLIFSAICAFILRHLRKLAHNNKTEIQPLKTPLKAFLPALNVIKKAPFLPHKIAQFAFIGSFLGLALLPLLVEKSAQSAKTRPQNIEWATQMDGKMLRPLALSAVEQRFAKDFPGAIARFMNGDRIITLHHVEKPTRKLHPAVDCYRALGYKISQYSLEEQASAQGTRLQRCFLATLNGQTLRICESILDARGQQFTDTSAWYWASLSGQSKGPWQVVTSARIVENAGGFKND